MKRITSIPMLNPVDPAPIPSPNLTFRKQKATAAFPTGGLFSAGTIKFNIENQQMVNLAKQAFSTNSDFKDDANALNCFLLSLEVTSKFEGGFDALNTYD